jgi:hypothetical protein
MAKKISKNVALAGLKMLVINFHGFTDEVRPMMLRRAYELAELAGYPDGFEDFWAKHGGGVTSDES